MITEKIETLRAERGLAINAKEKLNEYIKHINNEIAELTYDLENAKNPKDKK